MAVLRRAAAPAAGQAREATALQPVERLTDDTVVVVHHGVAVGRLVAREPQPVQRERVHVRRRALLLKQAAKHPRLGGREVHSPLGHALQFTRSQTPGRRGARSGACAREPLGAGRDANGIGPICPARGAARLRGDDKVTRVSSQPFSQGHSGAPSRGRSRHARFPAPGEPPVRALPRPPERTAGLDLPRCGSRGDQPVPAQGSARQGASEARHHPAGRARAGNDRAVGHHERHRRRADVAVQPGRPAGHARPACIRVRAPAADVACLLHAHPNGRGAVAHRQRHRRDRQRRDLHGDVDRAERDDRRGDRRRNGRAGLAPGGLLAGAAAVLRVAHAARRRGAPPHPVRAPGSTGGYVDARRGVPLGVRHPARQDDGPRARARTALQRRVRRTGGPGGPRPHGGSLANGVGADELRDHAGGRLLVCRRGPQRDLDRNGGRLHDAADADAVPDPVAPVGGPRSPDLDGALRADLRVPRPAGRHRRAPWSAPARGRARRRSPGEPVVPLLARGSVDARGDRRRDPSGDAHGARRRDRLGQDHAGLPGREAVRARGRLREHRRRRHPRYDAAVAGRHRGARLPGDLPVPRLDPGEPALRMPGGDGRGDRRRRSRGADTRADREPARRL